MRGQGSNQWTDFGLLFGKKLGFIEHAGGFFSWFSASGCKWLQVAASGCSSGCSSGCKWLLLPNSKYVSYARSLDSFAYRSYSVSLHLQTWTHAGIILTKMENCSLYGWSLTRIVSSPATTKCLNYLQSPFPLIWSTHPKRPWYSIGIVRFGGPYLCWMYSILGVSDYIIQTCSKQAFFPTCQVRVVRLYHSCSPPPRLAILLLLLLLLRQHLLHHLCLHFHVHCSLANSSPSSSPTSELSVHRWTSTWDLHEPSQLSGHRWTLTWDLPSSVGTAGPQPGTCPAQCAPLDLDLGPSQLSAHCWTSTWDLPSSVCTAGPQRPHRMPEDMPDRMSGRMPEDMPEDMPDKAPECLPDKIPEDMPDRMPEGMPDRMPDKVPECLPERMPEDLPDRMSEDMPDRVPEDMPDRVPEDMPEHLPEDVPDRMPEDMPDKMPEDMSDRMPQDLPVTKRIDVMVGITRSKVYWRTQS